MLARDAHKGAPDLIARGALGLALGGTHGLSRQRHIDHHAFVHTLCWLDAKSDDANLPTLPHFTDKGTDLCGSNIQSNYNALNAHKCLAVTLLGVYFSFGATVPSAKDNLPNQEIHPIIGYSIRSNDPS